MVTAKAGQLPIILSAPHGGTLEVHGVPIRQGHNAKSFTRLSDFNTAKLTERIADCVASRMGVRPYVVIANFHRRFLDANRRPRDAFESADAEPVYRAFHDALAKARDDVVDRGM
ncbi:MAG: hypothetical protein AAGD07_04355 [Planctomycetota bacterium]